MKKYLIILTVLVVVFGLWFFKVDGFHTLQSTVPTTTNVNTVSTIPTTTSTSDTKPANAKPVEPVDTAPKIFSISPTSGVIDTQVVVKGSGFTNTGNKIQFGNSGSEFNPVYNLASSDGTTLVFNVPSSNYYSCQNSRTPCMMANYEIQSGTYPVSIINANGTSNAINFTVNIKCPNNANCANPKIY